MILNESPIACAPLVQAVAVAEFVPLRAGTDRHVTGRQVDDTRE